MPIVTVEDEASTPVARLLLQLARLDIDPAFAFAYLTEVLRDAPPATEVRLPASQRDALLADGRVTEAELADAEDGIRTGRFTLELLEHALLALASFVFDDELLATLGATPSDLDDLYEEGRMVGRSFGPVTVTPRWLIDTAQPDGLIPHSQEVLRADAPEYLLSFGRAVYEPHGSLRGSAPMTPKNWLSEGHEVNTVAALLAFREPAEQ